MTGDEHNPYAPPRALSGLMRDPVPRSRWPWWVKLGAFGISGPGGLWAFLGLCLALAVGFFVAGFWFRPWFVVTLASLWSALMYWLTIRWINRHGSWARGV